MTKGAPKRMEVKNPPTEGDSVTSPREGSIFFSRSVTRNRTAIEAKQNWGKNI